MLCSVLNYLWLCFHWSKCWPCEWNPGKNNIRLSILRRICVNVTKLFLFPGWAYGMPPGQNASKFYKGACNVFFHKYIVFVLWSNESYDKLFEGNYMRIKDCLWNPPSCFFSFLLKKHTHIGTFQLTIWRSVYTAKPWTLILLQNLNSLQTQ